MKRNGFFAAPLIAAGIFLLCAPIPGQAADVTQTDAQRAQKRTAAPGKTPTTPLELLQNIKLAFDQGLPLSDDFYTDANLMKFFGGKKVVRVMDDPTAGPQDIVREVTDFGTMVEPVKVGNFAISGISLILRRSVSNDGRISGSLALDLLRAVPSLDFDHVTGLYGPNWTVPKKPKLPHMKPAPARQAHGNAEIEYLAGDADNEFTFNPDAVLGAAMFILNGKKQ
jgi:hypothetical protein